MRNDVPTMEAGRVRWAPGKSLWLLCMSGGGQGALLRHFSESGLARAGRVRRLALPADLPHRPALVAWPTQTLQGRTS